MGFFYVERLAKKNEKRHWKALFKKKERERKTIFHLVSYLQNVERSSKVENSRLIPALNPHAHGGFHFEKVARLLNWPRLSARSKSSENSGRCVGGVTVQNDGSVRGCERGAG